MNYAHLSCSLCLSLLALAASASCSSTHDNGDFVPSQPGALQPDGGGALLKETTACAELDQAENDARKALGCEPAPHQCPDYIRPAGGADCFEYDKTSIDACRASYQSFASCDQFDGHPCLITAVSKCAGAGGGGGTGVAEGGAAGQGAGGASSSAGVAGLG